jgi:hypothetical protein
MHLLLLKLCKICSDDSMRPLRGGSAGAGFQLLSAASKYMAHAVQQLSWPVPAVPGRTGTSSVLDRPDREGAWRIG